MKQLSFSIFAVRRGNQTHASNGVCSLNRTLVFRNLRGGVRPDKIKLGEDQAPAKKLSWEQSSDGKMLCFLFYVSCNIMSIIKDCLGVLRYQDNREPIKVKKITPWLELFHAAGLKSMSPADNKSLTQCLGRLSQPDSADCTVWFRLITTILSMWSSNLWKSGHSLHLLQIYIMVGNSMMSYIGMASR